MKMIKAKCEVQNAKCAIVQSVFAFCILHFSFFLDEGIR